MEKLNKMQRGSIKKSISNWLEWTVLCWQYKETGGVFWASTLPCCVSALRHASHSVYLLVISSTKLLKVLWNVLHGWFSDMGLILVAPSEIFNLSGALVSEYVSSKAATLELSTASSIIGISLCLSIIGRWWTALCLFYWLKSLAPFYYCQSNKWRQIQILV